MPAVAPCRDTRRRLRRRLGAWVWALLVLAPPAWAHLEFFPGRLLDLIRTSDTLVIATVDSLVSDDGSRRTWMVHIHEEQSSSDRESPLTTHARLAIESGKTYAFFVKRRDGRLDCVHPAGTVLPAGSDVDVYRRLDRDLRRNLAESPERLAATLIPGLRASTAELRYQVALTLLDVAHADHALDPVLEGELRQVLDSPEFDEALRPLLQPLIATEPLATPDQRAKSVSDAHPEGAAP